MALFLGGFPAGAAWAEPLTVEHALALARQNNPDIIAARQELEVARGHLVTARYLNPVNPEIGAEGNHRQFAGGGGATDYGITLSQQVEVGGQRNRRIAEAESETARVQATVQDRERLLEADVTQAFFTALAAERRLALQRSVEDLNRRIRDASVARVHAGDAAPMEGNLAEIRYGQSRKDTISAESARIAALLDLRRLLGLSPERSIEPTGDLRPSSTSGIELASALEKALAHRPDLRAATAEIRRAAAETALTRRLRIPNPTIEGFYHTDTNADSPGADTIAGAGVRIPLPLFDRKQGDLIALAAVESQARELAEGTRQRIEKEVTEAVSRYDAARRVVAVFEADVLGRVEETFGFIEAAYRAGKIDLLQFVVVQNDLMNAQLSYLDSLVEFRAAEVHLEQVIGAPL